MKKILMIIFMIVFWVYAQEREFDMSQLNQSMGNIITSDDADFADSTGEGNQDGIGIVILRIIGSLALVLALLAAIVWGLRKSGVLGQGVITAANQTPSMSVLEALSTGYNGAILLVRCEEQVFLVGQTPTNYTLLQELQQDVAKKVIESKGGNENVGAFKNSLANFMQNLKNQKNTLRS
jgi:flagellar biogenesis protein FliO